MTVTLGDLQAGDEGKILAFNGAGAAYRRKLLALGVIPGTQFTISRVAPLGDPIQIQVRGFHLSLRRDEASSVEVVPV